LPINLVKAVLKAGHGIASKVPQAEMYVKDIDIDLLLQAIENEKTDKSLTFLMQMAIRFP